MSCRVWLNPCSTSTSHVGWWRGRLGCDWLREKGNAAVAFMSGGQSLPWAISTAILPLHQCDGKGSISPQRNTCSHSERTPPAMALDQAGIKELCEELAKAREHYFLTLDNAHNAVVRDLAALERLNGTIERGSIFPFPSSSRQSQVRSDLQNRNFAAEHDAYVPRRTLPAETFTENDFLAHLKFHPWPEALIGILKPVLYKYDISSPTHVLKQDPDPERAKTSYIQLELVGLDGVAQPALPPGDAKDVARTWRGFSCTNDNSMARQQAFGKIGFVCEPTPLSLAIIHLTMNPHFDMDDIYASLVDSTFPTTAVMDGCFESDHRKQRSFVYTLKYHTLIGDERQPMEWQMATANTVERIPISTCCSSVALSLSGTPLITRDIAHLRGSERTHRAGLCNIFDPFAPWRLLSLHFCPDWKTTVDVKGSVIDEKYINGPEAFLSCLLTEFRDATVRLEDVGKRIAALVTPPVSRSLSLLK
jgi:hypothetical protein